MNDDDDDDNVIAFPTIKQDAVKEILSENEVRAAATMLWAAVTLSRVKLAKWHLRGRKPTQDELFWLAHNMHAVEKKLLMATDCNEIQNIASFDRLTALMERKTLETQE